MKKYLLLSAVFLGVTSTAIAQPTSADLSALKNISESIKLQSEAFIPTIKNEHGNLTGTAQDFELVPAISQTSPRINQTVGEWLNSGRAQAKNVLAQAAEALRGKSVRTIMVNIYNKLGRVTLHVPPAGYNFKGCSTGTLAFTFVNGNDIYICRAVVDDSFFGVDELAQILVHEGAHDVGYANECDATIIEVAAMRLSNVGLRFKNGYWERCNIH